MSDRDHSRLNARRDVHRSEMDRGGVTVQKAGAAPPAPILPEPVVTPAPPVRRRAAKERP